MGILLGSKIDVDCIGWEFTRAHFSECIESLEIKTHDGDRVTRNRKLIVDCCDVWPLVLRFSCPTDDSRATAPQLSQLQRAKLQ